MNIKAVAATIGIAFGSATLPGCDRKSADAQQGSTFILSTEELAKLRETIYHCKEHCLQDPLIIQIRKNAELNNCSYFVGDTFSSTLKGTVTAKQSSLVINRDGLTCSWYCDTPTFGSYRNGSSTFQPIRTLHVEMSHITKERLDVEAEAIAASILGQWSSSRREILLDRLTEVNQKLEKERDAANAEMLVKLPVAAIELSEIKRSCEFDPLVTAIRIHSHFVKRDFFIGSEFKVALPDSRSDDPVKFLYTANLVLTQDGIKLSMARSRWLNGSGFEAGDVLHDVEPEHVVLGNFDQAQLHKGAEEIAGVILNDSKQNSKYDLVARLSKLNSEIFRQQQAEKAD